MPEVKMTAVAKNFQVPLIVFHLPILPLRVDVGELQVFSPSTLETFIAISFKDNSSNFRCLKSTLFSFD